MQHTVIRNNSSRTVPHAADPPTSTGRRYSSAKCVSLSASYHTISPHFTQPQLTESSHHLLCCCLLLRCRYSAHSRQELQDLLQEQYSGSALLESPTALVLTADSISNWWTLQKVVLLASKVSCQVERGAAGTAGTAGTR